MILTRDDFWALVKEINWPHCDYNAWQVTLLKRYANPELEVIQGYLHEYYVRLSDAVDAAEDEGFYLGLTDDGRHDLLHHAIGLGEEAFRGFVKDVRGLKKVDVTESFAYVFPDPADRDSMGEDHFVSWAKKLYEKYRTGTRLSRIERGLNGLHDGLGSALANPIYDAYGIQMQMLMPAVTGQGLTSLRRKSVEFEANLDAIEKRQSDLVKKLGKHFLRPKTGANWPSDAYARNFIHDLIKYHGKL